MSENLDVRATLTAIDHSSPVIAGLLKNVRKLEETVKKFNATFEAVSGKSFSDSFASKMKRQADDIRKTATTYRDEWQAAYVARLRDAQVFHRQLDRIERQSFNRRQAEQRAVDRGYRSAGLRSTSPTSALIAGGVTFFGIASAFRKRMEVNVAETKAQIFGGLSSAEVKKLRGDWSDQIAIRFGESASAVLDSYTEALKQGFSTDSAKKIAIAANISVYPLSVARSGIVAA
jgi:hypothetical protein